MGIKELTELLESVRLGNVQVGEAVEKLRHMPFEDLGFAKVDHHRHLRCGFPEVIFCPGKATEHIVEIFLNLKKRGNNILATRANEEIYQALLATGQCGDVQYEPLGKTIVLRQKQSSGNSGYICVVTAGTADIPVAMEAVTTAEIMDSKVELVCDVGVAGIHRLLEKVELLRAASVVIVIAGMEGALASVVGGLVDCPVIAVPTSIGYGASFEGLAALLSMLNSCASGVTVVNIDNGFSAGYTAAIIDKKIHSCDA